MSDFKEYIKSIRDKIFSPISKRLDVISAKEDIICGKFDLLNNNFEAFKSQKQNIDDAMLYRAWNIQEILAKMYLDKLKENPIYKQKNRLELFEFKVYSQAGEDGIIHEIFKRIKPINKFFVEIGVQDGIECNTHFLLVKGWKGVWIEADNGYVESINKNFEAFIKDGHLRIIQEKINPKNINEVLKDIPSIDFLSVDIDGNDYYVLEALEKKPSVICVEYNGIFPPDLAVVQPYKESFWDGTNNFGASLKAFELLMSKKGYKLVGTTIGGVNAFFVKNELWSKDIFPDPPTSEYLYNNFKNELIKSGAYHIGHKPAPTVFRAFDS